jgi:hypothetical protein
MLSPCPTRCPEPRPEAAQCGPWPPSGEPDSPAEIVCCWLATAPASRPCDRSSVPRPWHEHEGEADEHRETEESLQRPEAQRQRGRSTEL